MKKIFTPFLFIVATLLLCSTTVKGDSGTTDDGLSWDLTNRVLTISGTGAMMDYATYGGVQSPWYTFKESVTKIIVNEGVTALGAYAFYSSINCTEISLPSTLTDIKNYALANCSTVTKITCKASTPPTLPAPASSNGIYRCFDKVPTNCPIYVPKQSVNTYKATAGWSTFTNYQELEEGTEGGGDSPVPATPTITVSKSSLNMGKFIPGYTTTSKTFTVTGRDLTDDIMLAVSGSAIIIDKTTITKEDAAAGVTVTVALAPTANAPFEETITIVSTGADNKTITVTGDLMGQQNIAKLSDLSGNAMDDILYTYTGNTATVLSSTTDELILKDNGAFTVNVNEALTGKLPVGVAIKVKNFTFTAYSQYNMTTDKYTYTLTPITIDFETEYIRTVDKVGKYGTICLPYNVPESKRTGATFYKIAYKDLANSVIVLEEVGDMVAGVPYIFHSSALEIVCNYGIDYASDASSENGLIGSFEQREISDGHDNYYVLYSNQLWKAGSSVSVGANRAYIDISDVCEVGEAPSQAPGRKRVTMAVEGEQTSTNIHNISTTQGTAEKVLINGSLYIMRDGTIYNISGQIVK